MTKEQLWGERFAEPIDPDFSVYQSSLRFDRRLLLQDLRGSLAHAEMLAAQGILTAEDGLAIRDGLTAMLRLAEEGQLELPEGAEDVHTAVEILLRERIGAVAGRLHTARSRNDQVATDVRLFVKDATATLRGEVAALRRTLLDQAELHLSSRGGSAALMPGYTHMQAAQPLHLSHWHMAYYEMLTRDQARLGEAMRRADECPLGAAALCGTSWPIDRARTAATLGFSRPMRNSIDAVASRDFAIDFLAACSSVMLTLSRLSEDLIIYSTVEFGFVVLPDSLSTGSSIMPQKKNPDLCELTRAKAGRVIGHQMALMTVMKGLPTAYNKDLQEDKEAIFDTFDTVAPLLPLWRKLLSRLKWQMGVMAHKAEGGFATATELADAMAQRGTPFREAHAEVGALVAQCARAGRTLAVLPLDGELLAATTLDGAAERRRSFGGSSTELIRAAIACARNELEYA